MSISEEELKKALSGRKQEIEQQRLKISLLQKSAECDKAIEEKLSVELVDVEIDDYLGVDRQGFIKFSQRNTQRENRNIKDCILFEDHHKLNEIKETLKPLTNKSTHIKCFHKGELYHAHIDVILEPDQLYRVRVLYGEKLDMQLRKTPGFDYDF